MPCIEAGTCLVTSIQAMEDGFNAAVGGGRGCRAKVAIYLQGINELAADSYSKGWMRRTFEMIDFSREIESPSPPTSSRLPLIGGIHKSQPDRRI
jgi:hypothetical protein